MIREFLPGQCLHITSTVHAKNSSSPTGTSRFKSPHQDEYWKVIGYSKEGTENNIEDDIIGLVNEEGENIYVPFSEFSKLQKVSPDKCHW